MTKQQILIGLDTAIGCIIWTAPDYSSPERQRLFIVKWQQTSHGLLQPAELRGVADVDNTFTEKNSNAHKQ